MATVIALDEYRRRRKELTRPEPEEPARPEFRADDVWGRNYTELDSVVFGLLKVRETLRFYTDYDPVVEELLLDVLDAAFYMEDKGFERLRAAILPLKECLLEQLEQGVIKPLKTALIILDLIEKSPMYR